MVNRQVTDADESTDLFSAFNEGEVDVVGAELNYQHQMLNGNLVVWASRTSTDAEYDIAPWKMGVRYYQVFYER